METARVVVIGGGVVGVCCLHHLCRAGESDALLVEREELTAGSSWHAAGHVTAFAGNWGAMRAQAYARRYYDDIAATVARPFALRREGCLYPARTPGRMDHLRHVAGMALGQGLPMEMLGPEAFAARHRLLEPAGLAGGLWDPGECTVDPAQIVHAIAQGAREMGARIRRHDPVEALEQRKDGGWLVRCRKGDIRAGIVVNAAGFRGGEVAAMMGRRLPIAVLAHQYVVTGDADGAGASFPIYRDLDGAFYLRRERGGLLLGSYGHKARQVWRDGVPADFGQELFPDDWDQLEAIHDAAMAQFPILESAGVRRFVNGPIAYTPDAQPLVGPAPGLRNAYHACASQVGFCQGPAIGKAVAETIVHGETEWDGWPWDPRRFGAWAGPDFTAARVAELYENQYAPPWPHRVWLRGRPVARSPLHDALAARGAVHAQIGGWERPIRFRTAAARGGGRPSFRHEAWRDAARGECEAVRDRVGAMDHCGFTRYRVTGPGAARWLDRVLCSRLPSVGRVRLGYALTEGGAIATEATVTRLAADEFVLLGPTLARTRDLDCFRRLLPGDGSVSLADETGDFATLMVMGPRSRSLLSRLTEADLSNAGFPWMSARPIALAGIEALALRVSFVGELGWELHMAPGDAPAAYSALRREGEAFGLRDFGAWALDSMRIEKGYPGWQAETGGEYTPFDAGLERFVAFDKAAFRGREALLARRGAAPDWTMVMLEVEPGDSDPHPGQPVLAGSAPAGFVTSGSTGYRTGRCLALGFVETAAAERGDLAILMLGERKPARRLRRPPYDPDNARLRA